MGSEPGESPRREGGRVLERPPSERYGAAPSVGDGARRSALTGPLVRALVIAILGSAALIGIAAYLASTAGLLFVGGVMGAGIGLVLARARAPRDERTPVPAKTVTWLAVGLALAAVVVADVATWVVARGEGGTLGPIDYLLQAFGPFVPAVPIVAVLAAAWGAGAGPVERG
jgi:hypothetical protein